MLRAFVGSDKEYPRSVRDKAIVIKNGIDTSHYIFNEIERNSIRKLYDLTDITLCHIGRFVKVKNQSFVVDVFYEVLKKRPRAKLLLIGDGSDKESIQNKCGELGLTDSSIFIGGVSDMNPYLQASDLVSFIPLRENPEEWAEFIINKYNEVEVDRVKYNEFTKTAGFDINHTVEQLCEYYADLPAER